VGPAVARICAATSVPRTPSSPPSLFLFTNGIWPGKVILYFSANLFTPSFSQMYYFISLYFSLVKELHFLHTPITGEFITPLPHSYHLHVLLTVLFSVCPLRPGPWFHFPQKLQGRIGRGMDRGGAIAYAPWIWRWIMLAIRMTPETIFNRVNL